MNYTRERQPMRHVSYRLLAVLMTLAFVQLLALGTPLGAKAETQQPADTVEATGEGGSQTTPAGETSDVTPETDPQDDPTTPGDPAATDPAQEPSQETEGGETPASQDPATDEAQDPSTEQTDPNVPAGDSSLDENPPQTVDGEQPQTEGGQESEPTQEKPSETPKKTPVGKTNLQVRVHMASYKWLSVVKSGKKTGVTGSSKRMDLLYIKLTGGYSKGIAYRVYLSKGGWQSWKRNGKKTGKAKGRIEAIKIKLEGAAAQDYDVYYRVYAQGIGWMAWTSNGAAAGTIGLKLNVEAVQVRLVGKGNSVSLEGGAYPGALVNAKTKKPKGMTVKVLHQMEHGYKSPYYQRCIVMHDTEEHRSFDAWGSDWVARGGVGTQFMVDRKGRIRQYASMNQICWHAGGATYERLDTKFNVVRYKSGAGSAMNQCSIGIEMDHVPGEDYTKKQLDAVDRLIAYIDAYYGYACTILQHKDYRLINTDCSKEFKPYLKHLKKYRTTR